MAELLVSKMVCFLIVTLHCMQLMSANPASSPDSTSLDDGKETRIDRTPKIINGDPAEKGAYPFIVSIVKNISGIGPFPVCGASVYDRNHVVTAAHCLINTTEEDLFLFFGQWDWNQTEAEEDMRLVKRILVHPKYDPNLHDHDIAVLVLKEPLSFTSSIQPICLTHKPVKPGENAYVMGWGDTNGTAPWHLLQVAMVPIIDREQCNHFEWLNDTIVNGMICAGYEEGGKDSCQGDSGGPLVRETDDGFQLIGVVSWGFGCALKKKPGVYADVFYYRDWIVQISGKPDYGNNTQIKCPEPIQLGVSFSPKLNIIEKLIIMALLAQASLFSMLQM